MKKILFFLGLIFMSLQAFSLDYENLKALVFDDHFFLYVNSPEGLRIRDKPSLSSNKIGRLYHNMEIKPVEIGKEETIDGIKSNWVKIIIPAESLQKNRPVYGWVFGGYLEYRPKAFTTENWTGADLIRYLSRFSWVSENYNFSFGDDLHFNMGLMESGAGRGGTYSVSMKDKNITTRASFGDEESQGPVETDIYQFEIVDEGHIILTGEKKKYDLKPSITYDYYYSRMFQETPCIYDYEKDDYTAFCYLFAVDIINELRHKLDESGAENAVKEKENFIKNLTLLGVDTGW